MDPAKHPKGSTPAKLIKIKLNSPRSTEKQKHHLSPSSKLNQMKLKVYYKQMQLLQSSPKINRISKALVKSKASKKPPKSSYVRSILTSTRSNGSLLNQSKTSINPVSSSSKFAVMSLKLVPSQSCSFISDSLCYSPVKNPASSPKKKPTVFTRGLNLIEKRNRNLELMRKSLQKSKLSQCTFRPDLSKNNSTYRSMSLLSSKSRDVSVSQDGSKSIRYVSFSPLNIKYGFQDGCDMKLLRQKSTPMFRYASMQMPLI